MVEQDWVPMDQAEARVDRIGQTQPVTVHYLLAADTLDEQIHDLVERKRTVVAAATDGTPAPTDGDDMDAVYGFLGI
jgi:SNF2 family DNA or RNA helicase